MRQLDQDLNKAYFSGVLARQSAGLQERIMDILQEIEQDRQQAFQLGVGRAHGDQGGGHRS